MRAALRQATLSPKRPAPSSFAVNGVEPVALWDFANGAFPAGFSHSRASTGTAIAADGSFVAQAADSLRYDLSGTQPEVILEGAATNLLSHSAATLGAGWSTSGGSAANLALGALGVFGGCRVTSGGATWHRLLHSARPLLTAGTAYTLTTWFILGTSAQGIVILRDNTGATESRILATAAGTSIQSELAGSLTNVAFAVVGSLVTLSVTFTPNFTRDLNLGIGPASAVSGEDVIVLGAQLCEGPAATTYIPTLGASAQRAADVVEWSAPQGVYDLRRITGNGIIVDQTAVAISAGWSASLPLRAQSMALYPVGTL